MDEVPCNSNLPSNGTNYIPLNDSYWRRPSGDWTGLNPSGIHLMLSLKPIDGRDKRGALAVLADTIQFKRPRIDLHLNEDFIHLKLNRIYRFTNNITRFQEEVFKNLGRSLLDDESDSNKTSISKNSVDDIDGDYPEVLLLPQRCGCLFSCEKVFGHFFVEHKTSIIALMKRVQLKHRVGSKSKLSHTRETKSCS